MEARKSNRKAQVSRGQNFPESSVQMEQDTFKGLGKLYFLILGHCFPERLGGWKVSEVKQHNFVHHFS